jgi:peroxiredoxin
MEKTAMVFRRSLLAAVLSTPLVLAAQTVGQPAPAFSAVDAAGKPVSLADFKGKTVVLEWVNPGCPFVKKHYGAGNMQSTQKAAAADGVVWLTVSSTHPSSADYKKPAELAAWVQSQNAAATRVVMDDSGANGKAWAAKTTPHLYIVDQDGKLAYAGAIDSIPSAKADDIAKATNYVTQALGEIKAGKPVSKPATAPYGCSVKYS